MGDKKESALPERENPPTPNKLIEPVKIYLSQKPVVDSLCCPYCQSKKFVKRGVRKNKLEEVQLYLCSVCAKTFTPRAVKGRHYPLETIFEAISIYNMGYSFEDVAKIINAKKLGDISLSPSTISDWVEEFKENIPYLKMRPYAVQLAKPKDVVQTATLAHQQLYRYRFHWAKCKLIIKSDYSNRNFIPLMEYLQMVPAECPHQFFQEGERASESSLTFSKTNMIVRSKQNYATRLTSFFLQGAKQRKDRHDLLEKFFLYNDSVTVATEVPVYITKEDLEHFRVKLGFEYSRPDADLVATSNQLSPEPLPKIITGHIDLVQIRNGQVHIMDYKPNAQKEQPIDQLTLYAMALSRLTGLRLFEFKCAWFDENNYFEFFPLHVLYKPKKVKRRKQVETKEGMYKINSRVDKIDSFAPAKAKNVGNEVKL